MQTDPMEEWRRLTALYGEMGDVEIRELADQIGDLTPNAQQILRDELKKRGWSNDGPKPAAASRGENDAVVRWDQEQDTAADGYGEMSGGDQASDYSWKVALCRCDSLDEAAARGEMLRRAGIDCWIQRPGARSVVPWLELGVGDIQINVAADQLDQAKLIVAQPIPQAILDEVSEQNATPAYEAPVCPKCRATDPTLESVEPSNNWLCESCGYAWPDPIADAKADA